MTRPQSLLVSNHPLRCPHCIRWQVRRAQIHAPWRESFDADPAHCRVDVYVCAGCGHVQTFLEPAPDIRPDLENRGRKRGSREARKILPASHQVPAGREAVGATRTG
jgi:hypothetical protein